MVLPTPNIDFKQNTFANLDEALEHLRKNVLEVKTEYRVETTNQFKIDLNVVTHATGTAVDIMRKKKSATMRDVKKYLRDNGVVECKRCALSI